MDSYGIPRKINRYVLKAVRYYSMKNNGAKLSQILDFVKISNKNRNPVSNLKGCVSKAVRNLQRSGVLYKLGNNSYKTRITSALGLEHLTAKAKSTAKDGNNIRSTQIKEIETNQEVKQRKIRETRFLPRRLQAGKILSERKGEKTVLPNSRQSSKLRSTVKFPNTILPISEVPLTTRQTEPSIHVMEPGNDDRDSGDNFKIVSQSSLVEEKSVTENKMESSPNFKINHDDTKINETSPGTIFVAENTSSQSENECTQDGSDKLNAELLDSYIN